MTCPVERDLNRYLAEQDRIDAEREALDAAGAELRANLMAGETCFLATEFGRYSLNLNEDLVSEGTGELSQALAGFLRGTVSAEQLKPLVDAELDYIVEHHADNYLRARRAELED